MHKMIKTVLKSTIAVAIIFSCYFNPAFAKSIGNYERIGGKTRYDTSLQIVSKYGTSSYAILVSGEQFADALSSCTLSKKYNAPIILTNPHSLDDAVKENLVSMGVKKVFLVGGQGAISDNIENSLKELNMDTERIWGKTRYDTCIEVAKKSENVETIAVASGENFPDALAMASFAGVYNMPIILVNKNSIPDSVTNYIKDNNILKTYIIGGSGVISDSVASKFPNSERIGGKNRFETNKLIIDKFSKNNDKLYITSGLNFPDALSTTCLSIKDNAPVILVNENIDKNYEYFLKKLTTESTSNIIIGGEGAVSKTALYLAGLEEKPANLKPKPSVPSNVQKTLEPSIPKYYYVINVGETTKAFIKSAPTASSKNVGYTYGSLAEVKILNSVGSYYYVEVLNYESGNYIKGYVPKNIVKCANISRTYNILVDLNKQRVYIFKNGSIFKEFICSTGKDSTPTPAGRFLIGSKGALFTPSSKSVCYFWTRINNNYLFHSVIYDKSGYAITSEYKKLGQKASHGCIRLKYEDAKWLQDYIPRGTLVTIK